MSDRTHWHRRVDDMLARIERIERSIEGICFEDLVASNDKVDAIERNLEIIGEASNHIPGDIKRRYPETDWERIYGMRNVLAQGYDIVMEDIVWTTAKVWLPKLKTVLLDIKSKL